MTKGYTNLLVPEAVARKLVLDIQRAELPLAHGAAMFEFPAVLTPEDCAAIEEWLPIVMRAIRRFSSREEKAGPAEILTAGASEETP